MCSEKGTASRTESTVYRARPHLQYVVLTYTVVSEPDLDYPLLQTFEPRSGPETSILTFLLPVHPAPLVLLSPGRPEQPLAVQLPTAELTRVAAATHTKHPAWSARIYINFIAECKWVGQIAELMGWPDSRANGLAR